MNDVMRIVDPLGAFRRYSKTTRARSDKFGHTRKRPRIVNDTPRSKVAASQRCFLARYESSSIVSATSFTCTQLTDNSSLLLLLSITGHFSQNPIRENQHKRSGQSRCDTPNQSFLFISTFNMKKQLFLLFLLLRI